MLQGFDLVIFFVFLASVMALGLWAGRKEETSEDFFLAGRSLPWWAVAGSIFGTNVSANHIVGMLGIGFSIGFAQSHFELGAIPALLLLSYVLLPIYMKLRVFTLSEYLDKRFGSQAKLAYSIIMILFIIVKMTAGFYIGSRSLNLLLQGTGLEMGYVGGILALVLITSAYTIFGGLKAVVYTDVIQSVILLVASGLVAYFTINSQEVGGWLAMILRDSTLEVPKMNLYLPPDHPRLPWTGAFTGLMVLHLFYWSTNQFIVQRTLGAKSLKEARYGIVGGGFLKLSIPFVSVAGGVAAAQFFSARGLLDVAPDDAFPTLVSEIVPIGYGLFGIIAAGLVGAILSSIDSMMNSAATLVTLDIYKGHYKKEASEKELVFIGRSAIAIIVTVSALLAIFTYDPKATTNFFLVVSSKGSYFTPGLFAAFFLGLFTKFANLRSSLVCILLCPVYSTVLDAVYPINFLHRTFVVFVLCLITARGVGSKKEPQDERHELLFQRAMGDGAFSKAFIMSVIQYSAVLIAFVIAAVFTEVPRNLLGWVILVYTILRFGLHAYKNPQENTKLFYDDRVWSGALLGTTLLIWFVF